MTSELAAPARPSRAGDCIDSRYRLEAEIGAGGLGSVYRATQTKLARPVAVKLLHESWGASEVQRGRFEREAKALAALEHPNIVAVLDYGLSDDQPYIVMELLEGETLAQRLKQGSLPLEAALSITRQLLEALAFMHDAGLVHRDLKPSNVFLQRSQHGERERVKVLDFGLAKSTTPNPVSPDATLTRDGTVVGTPAYMSPEQATGDAVDARSDVYTVGVLLFQMLSGRLPFEGDAIEQVRSHLVAPVPALSRARPVRQLDSALEQLIWRAMAKRRDDRFASAHEMSNELAAIIRKNLHTLRLAPDTDPESFPSDMAETLDSRSSGPSALRVFTRKVSRWVRVGTRVFSLLSMLLVSASVALMVVLLRSDDDRADLVQLQQRVTQRMAQRLAAARNPAHGRGGTQPAPPPPAAEDEPPAAAPAQQSPALAAGEPAPAAVSGAATPGTETRLQPLAADAQPPAQLGTDTLAEPAAPHVTATPPDPQVPGLPPATNPWDRPLPKELRSVHRAIFAGSAGSDRTILALIAYSQAHPDDPRGRLLLAQLYYNRFWRQDAVEQMAIALQIELAARGAPEVLKNLVSIVANGKGAAEASRLIIKAFGSEALPVLDAQIAATQDPDAKGRLRYLRGRLQPAKR